MSSSSQPGGVRDRKPWMIGVASGCIVGAIASGIPSTYAQTTSPTRLIPPPHASQHGSHSATCPTPAPQMGIVDQRFIEMMIPHHQDAVDMANLALTRAKRPQLKALAVAIQRDQTREIQQMRDWYKAWYGKPVPASPVTMGNHGMMSHQPGTMQGMGQGMMQMDLVALKNAPDFDREFIRQMIPHHQMAVHMAQKVLNHSTRPEIRTLAQAIIKSQTAEIKEMQAWQQAWTQSGR